MKRRRTLASELDALRTEVAMLKAATLDLDRRLRVLEHGTTWPVSMAEFAAHVTHDNRGVEVVR
jgi:hypothetical protein